MRDLYQQAKDLFQEEQYEKALPLLQQAVQRYSRYADIHNMLGVVLSLKSCYNESISHFISALEINENYTEARFNLAITYSNIGLSGDAQKELADIIKADQRNNCLDKEANYKLADLFAEIGEVMTDLGYYGLAVFNFNKALEHCETFVDIHNKFGLCYMAMHLYGEAIARFKSAVKLSPEYTEARINLGLAYYHNGQSEQALLQWRKVLSKENSNRRVCQFLELVQSYPQ